MSPAEKLAAAIDIAHEPRRSARGDLGTIDMDQRITVAVILDGELARLRRALDECDGRPDLPPEVPAYYRDQIRAVTAVISKLHGFS